MKMSAIKYCCTAVFLSLLLAACLPGKKEEEKVISDAVQATQQVAAQRLAADMSNAAQSLLASNNLSPDAMDSLKSNDLQTVKCSDGKSVVAFIPRTSNMAKGGTLAPAMANKIRDQLKTKFTSDAVGSKELIDRCQAGNIETVAINSPVLMLDNVSANYSKDKDENTVSVNVASCPSQDGKTVPGVTVTKTKKDGTTTIENHCGQPIEALDNVAMNLELDQTSMPDWKKQLLNKDSTASASFKCVIRKDSGKCTPLTSADAGAETVCDDANAKDEYLSNPVATPTGFVSGTADVSCNRGWHGQLIKRIKSKQCSIVRNGVKQTPSIYVDQAVVAVKCSKDNIENVPTQCPAGAGSFYAKYQKIDMVEPVLMEPQPAVKNQVSSSLIALPGYLPSQEVLDNVRRLTGSNGVYVPSLNLRGIGNDNDFTVALIKDMGARAKLSAISGCNIVGNQCSGDLNAVPEHIVIILDRSASMGSKNAADLLDIPPVMNEGYSCKAGLSNIFSANQSSEACSAAKEYLKVMPYQPGTASAASKVMDFVIHPWGNTQGPQTDGAKALYKKMEDSLSDKAKFIPYLQYSLANGWDCSGRTKTDHSDAAGSSNKESFPMDMYGTCSGEQSCDTCPGECVQTDIANVPNKAQRVDAAQLILKSLARMNLRPNTKITLAAFLNDAPNVETFTYCEKAHQTSAGTCDMALERQALIGLLTRASDVKQYVKPMSQEITIPTDKTVAAMKPVYILPDQRFETGNIKEKNSNFVAPAGTVITGRYHTGDENGNTKYEYATLKAVDENGNRLSGKIAYGEQRTYCWKESAGGISYWINSVMIGRKHDGDENGQTCHTYVNLTYQENSSESVNPSTIGDTTAHGNTGNSQSPYGANIKESAGIWFKTPERAFMTARVHRDDENGLTSYGWGEVTSSRCAEAGCIAACDVSECAKLPAVTANGDWESWSDANAKGTANDSGNYEYRSCTTLSKMGCQGTPGGPQAWFKQLNPVSSATAAAAPTDPNDPCVPVQTPRPTTAWITTEDADYFTYCSERRTRQDWITAANARSYNVFNDSVRPEPDYQDTDNYEFDQCTTVAPCKLTPSADPMCATDPSLPSCQATMQCDATYDNQWVMKEPPSGSGRYARTGQFTFCNLRLKKPTASNDNSDLSACLDKCAPRIITKENVQTCQTSKNLFTGVTATECRMIEIPTKIDYTSPGYSGRSVTQTITNYVPSKAGEPGAIPAASGAAVWGADFGGGTPLYDTIDAALQNAEVRKDLDAKKGVAFVVLTDGMDTVGSKNITSLCEDNNSLLSSLKTMDANAETLFISLNEKSSGISVCGSKVSTSQYVEANTLIEAPSKLGKMLAPGDTTISDNLKDAETFCTNTYGAGSVYKDDTVKTVAPTPTANICRAYEVK